MKNLKLYMALSIHICGYSKIIGTSTNNSNSNSTTARHNTVLVLADNGKEFEADPTFGFLLCAVLQEADLILAIGQKIPKGLRDAIHSKVLRSIKNAGGNNGICIGYDESFKKNMLAHFRTVRKLCSLKRKIERGSHEINLVEHCEKLVLAYTNQFSIIDKKVSDLIAEKKIKLLHTHNKIKRKIIIYEYDSSLSGIAHLTMLPWINELRLILSEKYVIYGNRIDGQKSPFLLFKKKGTNLDEFINFSALEPKKINNIKIGLVCDDDFRCSVQKIF